MRSRALAAWLWLGVLGVLSVSLVSAARAPSATAFSPSVEARNFSKGAERQAIYLTPAYTSLLAKIDTQNELATAQIRVHDPARSFQNNACARDDGPCAGDARLYEWQSKGYGIVAPVLFTARDGATISGHVWATRAGPARRPGVVITAGSVQADEQMYWYAAQALAKDGYVVLTTDPQGQGQSDTQGQSPDQNEGYPAQTDGRPFFDGTEDALQFFLSTPARRYEPRKSCSSGTSHAAVQDQRARSGLDAAYNPLWELLDPTRIGLAGHSLGATGISYIGQWDKRVKAIVAWDNLRGTDPAGSPGLSGILSGGKSATGELGCPADPSARTIPHITTPALGLSADYFLPPEPNTGDPDPLQKTPESFQYSRQGVDTGEIIIRGGTHYDFSWIPNSAFPATLRGADEIVWYTTAWFDRYLKPDPSADARLLSDRWRRDRTEAAVDPGHDGNMFSYLYRSRLDFHLRSRGQFVCENLRVGCPGLRTNDGYSGDFSYFALDTSPDAMLSTTPGVPTTGTLRPVYEQPPRRGCGSRRRQITFTLTPRHGFHILRIRVAGNQRVHVNFNRGRAVISVTLAHPLRLRIVVLERSQHRRITVRVRRTLGACST